MITHRPIGSQGKLGNQMFQYASVIGIAKKNNYDYCFDLNKTKLKEYFNVTCKECNNYKFKQDIGEGSFCFNSNLFNNLDDTSYHGYLQTEKYFEHCSEFIKKEFSVKQHIRDKVNNNLNCQEYVSIHVRRGDYLHLSDFHTNLDKQWYLNAMKHFPNSKFLFFSNDLEWCKNNFNGVYFSPFENEIEDLYAMSQCSGHIIANSSFSWWAAWLSSNKTVAPQKWFEKFGPQDWQDIYCKDWIKI